MSDPDLIRDPILEAAARALDNCIEGYQAVAVLAAVTPLIRAAALEEAAKMAEGHKPFLSRQNIAAEIRALKDQS